MLPQLPLVLQITEAWQSCLLFYRQQKHGRGVKQSELFEHSTDEPTVMQLPSINLIEELLFSCQQISYTAEHIITYRTHGYSTT